MAFATVREDEGLTVVIERDHARVDWQCSEPFRAITLAVHSSLDAVGFIAIVARALSDADIAANIISAYHHDHVLIPTDRADSAMHVLRAMTQHS